VGHLRGGGEVAFFFAAAAAEVYTPLRSLSYLPLLADAVLPSVLMLNYIVNRSGNIEKRSHVFVQRVLVQKLLILFFFCYALQGMQCVSQR
jgi:hypothetical protein